MPMTQRKPTKKSDYREKMARLERQIKKLKTAVEDDEKLLLRGREGAQRLRDENEGLRRIITGLQEKIAELQEATLPCGCPKRVT